LFDVVFLWTLVLFDSCGVSLFLVAQVEQHRDFL
jgi:hypothetical protein